MGMLADLAAGELANSGVIMTGAEAGEMGYKVEEYYEGLNAQAMGAALLNTPAPTGSKRSR